MKLVAFIKNMKLLTKILIIISTIILIGSLVFILNNKDKIARYLSADKSTNEETRVSQTNERNELFNQLIVTNDFVNIRSSNSVNSDILGKVYKDEIYTILDIQEDDKYYWYQIETSDNIKGYIASEKNSPYVALMLVNEDNIDNDNTNAEYSSSNTNSHNISNNTSNSSNNNNTNQNSDNNSNHNSSSQNNNNSSNNSNNSNSSNDSNNSNSSNDSGENSNNNSTVINATLISTCKTGWTLESNGKLCALREYSNIVAQKKCPNGYIQDGDKCVGEDRPNISATQVPYCTNGEMPSYASASGYYCRNGGSLYYNPECPSNYTLYAINGGRTCVWNLKGKTTSVSSGCSYPYPVVDIESGKCISVTYDSPSQKYTCPSGYTLDSTKCYK